MSYEHWWSSTPSLAKCTGFSCWASQVLKDASRCLTRNVCFPFSVPAFSTLCSLHVFWLLMNQGFISVSFQENLARVEFVSNTGERKGKQKRFVHTAGVWKNKDEFCFCGSHHESFLVCELLWALLGMQLSSLTECLKYLGHLSLVYRQVRMSKHGVM